LPRRTQSFIFSMIFWSSSVPFFCTKLFRFQSFCKNNFQFEQKFWSHQSQTIGLNLRLQNESFPATSCFLLFVFSSNTFEVYFFLLIFWFCTY
jgi:hypothetical protein